MDHSKKRSAEWVLSNEKKRMKLGKLHKPKL